LTAHFRVGDGQSRLWSASYFLCLFVEGRRPHVIAFLSVCSRQNRIAINVIWIELESPLCLANRLINLAVRDINPRSPATDSWRQRIELFRFLYLRYGLLQLSTCIVHAEGEKQMSCG